MKCNNSKLLTRQAAKQASSLAGRQLSRQADLHEAAQILCTAQSQTHPSSSGCTQVAEPRPVFDLRFDGLVESCGIKIVFRGIGSQGLPGYDCSVHRQPHLFPRLQRQCLRPVCLSGLQVLVCKSLCLCRHTFVLKKKRIITGCIVITSQYQF